MPAGRAARPALVTPRRLWWVAVTAVAVLNLATVASATPTFSSNPPLVEGQTVTSIPIFTVGSTDLTVLTVDVTLTGPGGDLIPQQAFPVGSSTPAFASAPDGLYKLTVSESPLVPPATLNFSVNTAGPAVVSGPTGITGASSPFTFTWTLKPSVPSSHWQLFDFATLIAEGDVAAPAASVALAPRLVPGDRTLNFRVSWRDPQGFLGLPGFWPPFIVDQTPPGAPVAPSGPVGTTRDLTPSFSWEGTELGGTFEWDVTNAAGAGIFAPGVARVTSATSVTTPTLPLAPNAVQRLTFHVRQVDPYGNRGPELTIPFTITTKPINPTFRRPVTRFSQFMTPAAGRVVSNLRPRLRWKRMDAGTSVFNVQIRLNGIKIYSKFPTRTSLRIPRGLLKPGRLYVWYVWSWIGAQKQYSSRRMTSYFLTRR